MERLAARVGEEDATALDGKVVLSRVLLGDGVLVLGLLLSDTFGGVSREVWGGDLRGDVFGLCPLTLLEERAKLAIVLLVLLELSEALVLGCLFRGGLGCGCLVAGGFLGLLVRVDEGDKLGAKLLGDLVARAKRARSGDLILLEERVQERT